MATNKCIYLKQVDKWKDYRLTLVRLRYAKERGNGRI